VKIVSGYFCSVLAVLALLARDSSSIAAAAQSSCDSLCFRVVNLRNDHGKVICTIFNSPDAFPSDDKKALRSISAPIRDRSAVCEFRGLPPGIYAVVAFHDENSNGEFNQNWLGMPQEGFGFSRDAPARFSPPKFKSASVSYAGGRFETVIHIRYW
jgi:uncharacterized protein (DUF2141 family)